MEAGQRAYRRHPGGLTIMGLVLIALAICLYFWSKSDSKIDRLLGPPLLLLIPFIPILIEVLRPHVVITNTDISVTHGSFGRRRTFSWNEIEKVQGSWETELEVVPNSGSSVQILSYQLPKKHRKNLREDLHKYLGDRVKVAGGGSKSQV